MKKIVLVAALLAMTGSAFAADLPLKAVKAPPPFDPWDIAFGGAVMSDYVFRGVTQSNHQPSVAAYFEPRYNVNKDLQLYIGTSGESISFANRRPPKLTFTVVSARPSELSPSISVSGVTSIPAEAAPTAFSPAVSPAARLPGLHHHDLPCERQRDEEGRQLLRSLRQG